MSGRGKTVVVTGATGYVGSHVIHQLLEKEYKVRGSVRNSEDPKNKWIFAIHPNAKENFTLHSASLDNEAGWDKIIEGTDGVFHIASPFVMKGTEEELINGAVSGTKNVLNAMAKTNVEKVILTSSSVAIMEGHPKEAYDQLIGPKMWSVMDKQTGYSKSKHLAELEAWKIAKEKNLKMTTVNPSLVLGPVLDKCQQKCQSMSIFTDLILRRNPMLPKFQMPIVDVRDVAKVHVNAFEKENVFGQRVIAAADGAYTMNEMCTMMEKHFEGYHPKKIEAPDFMLRAMKIFGGQYKGIQNYVGLSIKLDNSVAKNDLGVEFSTLDDTILESGLSLMKFGVLEKKGVAPKDVTGFRAYRSATAAL